MTCDVVVIGGGVIGLSVARRLAREGLGVTVLERGPCGGEASWAGAGVLSPCNPHRDDPVAHWQDRSLALYPAFCHELLDESGIDPEYDVCGELELAFDEQGLGIARSDCAAGSRRQLSDGRPAYALLSREETRELEPAVSPEIVGALHVLATAQVRNPRLLQALVGACRRYEVDIREDTPVEELMLDGSNVIGVRTHGEVITAGLFVLCGGAWSSQLHPRLESLMPVRPVRGQMILMELERRPFQPIIARGKTYLVPRRDGHVLLGATEEPDSGYAKRTTAGGIARLTKGGLRLVPSLADAPIISTWAGLRPGTPDDLPYIGPVPGFDRLLAATGHFRTGLTLAPGTAEYIAAIVSGRTYPVDLSVCRPGR
jgi:glycine oxidase